MRHVRAEEAFASTEEAERATSASADTPSGRLEWVTTRALNKQYESTDELLVDVMRTWGVLEERWTRENAPNRMEALREVKRAFEHTWQDKGIGERGGLVCIPSVGISREAIEVPRSSAPAYSHGSQVGVVGGEAVASAAHQVNVDGKQRGHMVSKVDGKERATRRALETCARVIRNFIKTEAAYYFREPVDPEMMNCPDYLDVVKQPMDLSTLLRRIETRELTTTLEVWEASKLIWDNCRLYNPESNAIVNICNFAESQFVAAWRAEGLHKMVETSPETSERSPPRKMTTASTTSRQSGLNRNWSSSSLMTAPPQERAGSKPSTTGRASYKCDVCKRSKKGRCGTETAPKSCLSRPENQDTERQSAILDRVSKLKPLQSKKPGDLKRKVTEAQAQEDGFRTLFDENDPDNFISQFEAHQRQARQIDMSQQSLHLANEHLRLQMMQNHRLARFDVQMLAQASVAREDASRVSVDAANSSASLSAEDRARAVRLQNELVNVVMRLNRAYLNQQRCVKMLSHPELSPAHVNEIRRAQHGQQMIVHQLQQRHQECSKQLHAYVQRGYKLPQQQRQQQDSDAGRMPAPSTRTTTQRPSAPRVVQPPRVDADVDAAYDALFNGLNVDDVSVAVAQVYNDDDFNRVDNPNHKVVGPAVPGRRADATDEDVIDSLIA